MSGKSMVRIGAISVPLAAVIAVLFFAHKHTNKVDAADTLSKTNATAIKATEIELTSKIKINTNDINAIKLENVGLKKDVQSLARTCEDIRSAQMVDREENRAERSAQRARDDRMRELLIKIERNGQ